MEEYLTTNDVAAILKIGKTKTYQLVNKKDFPKIKMGRQILIPKSKFENFMEKLVYKEYKI